MLCIELLIISISLSIDAFSLAVSVGINNKIYKKRKLYSTVVGLFHFFMPIIGFLFRTVINLIIILPSKLIFSLVIVFIIAGIFLEKKDTKIYIKPFLFGLSVSLDSLTMGITLNKSNVIIAALFFSINSYLFTCAGFKIAYKINDKYHDKSKIISIVLLLIILVYNVLV